MKRTIEVLNGLVASGILKGYALGGAMAATFYTEPLLTFDLDIFVALPGDAKLLQSLMIEGVPVQFLPVTTP